MNKSTFTVFRWLENEEEEYWNTRCTDLLSNYVTYLDFEDSVKNSILDLSDELLIKIDDEMFHNRHFFNTLNVKIDDVDTLEIAREFCDNAVKVFYENYGGRV